MYKHFLLRRLLFFVQLFLFFLTTAREEGVPRGRSEINSVKRRAFRYTCLMELADVLDFFGAVLILFGSTAVMMLCCLGIITMVPRAEEKSRERKEKEKNN